jgi:hypothetical protein
MNPAVISICQSSFDRNKKYFEEARDEYLNAKNRDDRGEKLAGLGDIRGFYDAALFSLEMAGFQHNKDFHMPFDEIKKQVGIGTQKVRDLTAGQLGVHIFAGFKKKHLDALKLFKAKYMPDIKVVLLPVESISFVSLETLYKNEDGSVQHSPFFTHVYGAGDYIGASLILDTAVKTSMALADHLHPFILPVAIKAKLRQKSRPTNAVLTCNFNDFFKVFTANANIPSAGPVGNVQIQSSASEVGHSECKIELLSGDINSAMLAAFNDVEKQLTNMFVEKNQV